MGKLNSLPSQLQREKPQKSRHRQQFVWPVRERAEEGIRAGGTSKYANICSYNEQRRQSAQQMALAEVRRDGATNGIHMKGKALLWVDAKKYHLFI